MTVLATGRGGAAITVLPSIPSGLYPIPHKEVLRETGITNLPYRMSAANRLIE
jgi:hypothetical protein